MINNFGSADIYKFTNLSVEGEKINNLDQTDLGWPNRDAFIFWKPIVFADTDIFDRPYIVNWAFAMLRGIPFLVFTKKITGNIKKFTQHWNDFNKQALHVCAFSPAWLRFWNITLHFGPNKESVLMPLGVAGSSSFY